MTIIVLRSIIIYVIVLLVIRVMGKRQIAQMQPLDVVITLIIADLATIPMSDLTIPLLNGILPLFVLTIMHFIITFFACKNLKVRNFVNGHAVILIGPEGILEENIKNLNMTIADLMETCRCAGYLSLDNVLYAIMETNGNISVIPVSKETPLTRSDLNIDKKETLLPYILISDGKISTENLKVFNIEEKEIMDFLQEQETKLKEVIVLQYSKDGKIYFQTKQKDKQILQHKLGNGEQRPI